MRNDSFNKDVSSLGIMARCKDIYETWRGITHWELTPGEIYHVTHIRMSSDFTYVTLEGGDKTYNSVCFEFLIDGNKHDIYSDERCWSDALIRRHQALEERYRQETETQTENEHEHQGTMDG